MAGVRTRRPPLVRSADDPAAFQEFYELHVQRVVLFFTRRTLDVETALDLTSETFAVALERRRQFRGETEEEERSWLFAVARGQLSHFWRRGEVERQALARLGLDPVAATSADIERFEELAEVAELRVVIARALHGLPPDQADAVRERVLRERSYGEISDAAGVSEQVVRARVSRGLRALASALGETDAEGAPQRV